MSHRYFPHTPEDVETMLNACGVSDFKALYSDVPEELFLKKDYELPSEHTEHQVKKFFNKVISKNSAIKANLAGGGFYSHHLPSVIPNILSRSEFLTAYTPYQPEISQGTLQYIFEYQTLMARLTGMEISNASLYDGATATAEAAIMAVANSRKKKRILVSAASNPYVLNVLTTYMRYRDVELTLLPITSDGYTDKNILQKELDKGDVAGVIVFSPNYYGILEDFTGWANLCHDYKSLLIMNCIAADLVSIKSPGEWGADIAVGDAQSLGIPLNFGGPYLGYICCNKSLMRKMPGRIVGLTTDDKGRRSFVLTLQAREQHIRREKATSNICSNQGLMALHVTIYMSLLGVKGLKEINEIGVKGAHWFAQKMEATKKVKLSYPNAPYFNEFSVTFTNKSIRNEFIKKALADGIIPGLNIGDDRLLIAVTETAEKEELDKLIEILENI